MVIFVMWLLLGNILNIMDIIFRRLALGMKEIKHMKFVTFDPARRIFLTKQHESTRLYPCSIIKRLIKTFFLYHGPPPDIIKKQQKNSALHTRQKIIPKASQQK